MFTEDLASFFRVDDFASLLTWNPSSGGAAQSAFVIFDAPAEILGVPGVDSLSTQYEIAYRADQLADLDRLEYVTVDGLDYQVREHPRPLDDGKIKAVRLTRC